MNKKYFVEEINIWESFLELEQPWNHLISLQKNKTLFVSFPLIKSYYEIIRKKFYNTHLKIIIIKNNKNEMIGIIPLTIEKQRIAGIFPLYKLGIKDNIIGLYSILIDPCEDSNRIIDEVLTYLKKEYSKWDILSLHHLPSDMEGIDDLLSIGKQYFYMSMNETKTLKVTTPSDISTILSNMKGKKRREMKRKIRRLSETGNLELLSINDPMQVSTFLPHFFEIEHSNWKGKKGTSLLKSEYKPFFENMAFTLSQNQQFYLYLLKIKQAFVSGIYAVVENKTIYFVKIGYDENYAKYSPSLVLFYLVFEQLSHQESIEYIDFFGPIDTYQKIFGNNTRTSYNLTLYNTNMISLLYYLNLRIFTKLQKNSITRKIIEKIKNIPFIQDLINNIY